MMLGAGSLVKWIFATLVLINAGALLSIVGRSGVSAEALSAARPFVYGVVAAVLAGAAAGVCLIMLAENATRLLIEPDYDLPPFMARQLAGWLLSTGVLAAAALISFVIGAVSVGGVLQSEARAERTISRGPPEQPPVAIPEDRRPAAAQGSPTKKD
jgi:hypothetical protein